MKKKTLAVIGGILSDYRPELLGTISKLFETLKPGENYSTGNIWGFFTDIQGPAGEPLSDDIVRALTLSTAVPWAGQIAEKTVNGRKVYHRQKPRSVWDLDELDNRRVIVRRPGHREITVALLRFYGLPFGDDPPCIMLAPVSGLVWSKQGLLDDTVDYSADIISGAIEIYYDEGWNLKDPCSPLLPKPPRKPKAPKPKPLVKKPNQQAPATKPQPASRKTSHPIKYL